MKGRSPGTSLARELVSLALAPYILATNCMSATEVVECKLIFSNADNEKMIDDGKPDDEDVVRKRTGGRWKRKRE